jgi:hypothetical protein
LLSPNDDTALIKALKDNRPCHSVGGCIKGISSEGLWVYLYRAFDSEGSTFDYFLKKLRDQKGVKRFLKKALRSFYFSQHLICKYVFVNYNFDYH